MLSMPGDFVGFRRNMYLRTLSGEKKSASKSGWRLVVRWSG
jgi:hypothetical protein